MQDAVALEDALEDEELVDLEEFPKCARTVGNQATPSTSAGRSTRTSLRPVPRQPPLQLSMQR